MKHLFRFLFVYGLILCPSYAQEDAWSYTNDNVHPGQEVHLSPQELEEDLHPTTNVEDNDPLEPVNRVIFDVNFVLDTMFLEPLAAMYKGVVHEFLRERRKDRE